VQACIRERCGDRLVYHAKQVIGITVPDPCELGLSEGEAARAVEQVQNVPQIDADLTRYVSALDQKLALLKITTGQSFELAAH
jgi:hypothetical protein